jgi:hypothetical protein
LVLVLFCSALLVVVIMSLLCYFLLHGTGPSFFFVSILQRMLFSNCKPGETRPSVVRHTNVRFSDASPITHRNANRRPRLRSTRSLAVVKVFHSVSICLTSCISSISCGKSLPEGLLT